MPILGVDRQHVRLLVLDILQPVLKAAQENVGFAQLLLGFGRDQFAVDEQFEDGKGRPDLQRRIAAAADELENLGHELDLADAAGAELDVVGHVLACHFAADLGVQVAHRVDGAEIEIFAEYEGPGDFLHGRHPRWLQVLAGIHGAALDPGVTLPFTTLGDEIVLQGVERTDQRAGIAIRAQAHVDPENLAVGRQVA